MLLAYLHCQGNVDEHSTGFRKQMFQSFLSHVALQQEDTTFSEKNPRFTTVWNESSKIRLEFQRCYNAGQDARGQAFWIGLSRCVRLYVGLGLAY